MDLADIHDVMERGTLLLNEASIEECLSLGETIEVVFGSFLSLHDGSVVLPPVVHLNFEQRQGELDIKSAYMLSSEILSVKVSSGWFRNEEDFGLPSGFGTILLIDATCGVTLAVMDGGHITRVRTGAAGAVAARQLARDDSETAFILGAGAQGRIQLRGLAEVLPNLQRALVFDSDSNRSERFKEEMTSQIGLPIEVATGIEDAALRADVIVTATPSREPLIMREWVLPGTHINAMGADGPGKQELDSRILRDADRVLVDAWQQARELGECQHAVSDGYIAVDDETRPVQIGAILAGDAVGRRSEEDITIFDSTGLAVQDLATAHLAYRQALKKDLGERFHMVSQ